MGREVNQVHSFLRPPTFLTNYRTNHRHDHVDHASPGPVPTGRGDVLPRVQDRCPCALCRKRASGMRSPSSTARRARTSVPTAHRLLASAQRARRYSAQCRTCTRKTRARMYCGGGITCWSVRSSIARRPYLSRPTGSASSSVRRSTCTGVCIFCVHSTCFGESLTCF